MGLLGLTVLVFFLGKLIFIKRYCEQCGQVTQHIVQYGYGRRFSYLMTFMTLGWRTIMMRYYPLECTICGHRFKTLKKSDPSKEKPKRFYDASDWDAFGGPKAWRELGLGQQIFMIIMISTGVFISIMYLFAKPILSFIDRFIM